MFVNVFSSLLKAFEFAKIKNMNYGLFRLLVQFLVLVSAPVIYPANPDLIIRAFSFYMVFELWLLVYNFKNPEKQIGFKYSFVDGMYKFILATAIGVALFSVFSIKSLTALPMIPNMVFALLFAFGVTCEGPIFMDLLAKNIGIGPSAVIAAVFHTAVYIGLNFMLDVFLIKMFFAFVSFFIFGLIIRHPKLGLPVQQGLHFAIDMAAVGLLSTGVFI